MLCYDLHWETHRAILEANENRSIIATIPTKVLRVLAKKHAAFNNVHQ